MTPTTLKNAYKNEIDSLVEKSYSLRNSKPKMSLALATKALTVANRHNDQAGKANCILNIGFYYLNKGVHNKAMQLFMDALFIAKEAGCEKGVAYANYNIGVLNFRLGNYDLALTNINDSLTLRKQQEDKVVLAKCYYQMAMISYELNDFEGTLRACKKAMRCEKEAAGLAAILAIEGRLFADRGDFSLAEECLKKSLEIRKSLGEAIGIASCTYYLIELSVRQENFEKAQQDLVKYGGIFSKIDFPYGQAQIKRLEAIIYMNFDHEEKVIETLKESIQIADLHQLRAQKNAALKTFSTFYESKGNFEKALAIYKDYHKGVSELNVIQSKKMLENIKLYNEINNAKKETDILRTSNYELNKANSLISNMHSELKSSMVYAKRIQDAIFPNQDQLTEIFGNCFLLNRPKDLVSGDFIWVNQSEGRTFVALADCTGHGVPGAILSVYANNTMNEAVLHQSDTSPSVILDLVRQSFIEDFMSETVTLKDGMDIALACIEGNKLIYSGAYRPLYILRKGEIIELKGDRQPVGLYLHMLPFKEQTVVLEKGDQIFLFSDGLTDQIGGDKGKKLKNILFRVWVKEAGAKRIERQKEYFDQNIDQWQGEMEQVDDMLMFSFKVK